MEDKELQELFAAKRTVEANRRRQEELRQMMEASASIKSRRLWPMWIGSAAAAVILLLIVMPALFRQPEASTILIAQADTIPQIATEETMPEQSVGRSISISGNRRPGRVKKEQQTELTVAADDDTLPYSSQEGTTDAVKIHPVQEMDQPLAMAIDEPAVNTPRIHRRTSTSMVCSNCNINNVPSQSSAFQDFLAATFGADAKSNNPFTLKIIEL